MKFLAQPYYDLAPDGTAGNYIGVYSLPANPGDAPITKIQFSDGPGPNCVVLYQDSTNVYYLFVSFDLGSTGVVNVYQFSAIADLTSAALLPAPTQIAFTNSVAGIAVQPGTGDLYVATFSNGNPANQGGNGGVYQCTRASGYTASPIQFSFYQSSINNTPQYCANLAFDLHGNLWMTGFEDPDPQNDIPAAEFLICFTQVTPPDNTKFFKIACNVNSPQFSNATGLRGSMVPGLLYPLSSPEGIAFDPAGNLWLGNNNDVDKLNNPGNGTLLRISSAWIEGLLGNPLLLTNPPPVPTVDGYFGTQAFAANDPGIDMYLMSGAQFGGLFFDGFTLYANDEITGVVWECDSTSIEATFAPSNIPSTNPGNGQMAIFDTTPAALLIRDAANDIGDEPDAQAVSTGNTWESPDIGVSQTQIPGLTGNAVSNSPTAGPSLVSDGSILGGTNSFGVKETAYVYVRVQNFGKQNSNSPSSSGKEVLKVYWAFAGMGLSWPGPWDGLTFDTGTKNAMGGLIGAVQIVTPIDPQNYSVFEIPWTNIPDSNVFSDGPSTHFCLLARIESSPLYPFGMDIREETSLTPGVVSPAGDNVVNDSKIAQRNIAVSIPAGGFIRIPPGVRFPVLGANYGLVGRDFRFGLETLNRDGKSAPIKGEVLIHAEGAARLRLLEGRVEDFCHQIADCIFRLHDPAKGIANLHIHSGENLRFVVEFTPEEDVRNFAVRVVQYASEGDREVVVGGQTFVVGEVKGFHLK